MRVLYLIAISFGFVALSSIYAVAAPDCNQVPYGKSCWRCAAWASLPTWKAIACSNSPSTAGGFACNIANCGLADATLKKEAPKKAIIPDPTAKSSSQEQ